ncbi:hypothetical protein ACIRQQ_43495 [Streptomyces fuscichromogenes]|uniref:hypothetical protein n=1 Tax=Streptomyces fuscichromogenes TaxID=1324013 RepID=UPI0038028367
MTPWIVSRDTVRLIDYMKRAFGAEELACLAGKVGAIEHAEVRIGDSVVMMFDASSRRSSACVTVGLLIPVEGYAWEGPSTPVLSRRRELPREWTERPAPWEGDRWRATTGRVRTCPTCGTGSTDGQVPSYRRV